MNNKFEPITLLSDSDKAKQLAMLAEIELQAENQMKIIPLYEKRYNSTIADQAKHLATMELKFAATERAYLQYLEIKEKEINKWRLEDFEEQQLRDAEKHQAEKFGKEHS